MCEATHNKLVQKIYEFVLELYKPYIKETFKKQEYGEKAISSHKNILESIKNSDKNQAILAIKESIELWKNLSNLS